MRWQTWALAVMGAIGVVVGAASLTACVPELAHDWGDYYKNPKYGKNVPRGAPHVVVSGGLAYPANGYTWSDGTAGPRDPSRGNLTVKKFKREDHHGHSGGSDWGGRSPGRSDPPQTGRTPRPGTVVLPPSTVPPPRGPVTVTPPPPTPPPVVRYVKPSTPPPNKLNDYNGTVASITQDGYWHKNEPNPAMRPPGTVTFWGNPPTHVTVERGNGQFVDVNFKDPRTGETYSKTRPYPVVDSQGRPYPYHSSYFPPAGSRWEWDGKWERKDRYIGGNPRTPEWLCWGFAANVAHDCIRVPKTR